MYNFYSIHLGADSYSSVIVSHPRVLIFAYSIFPSLFISVDFCIKNIHDDE
jgi:hypothetical protein